MSEASHNGEGDVEIDLEDVELPALFGPLACSRRCDGSPGIFGAVARLAISSERLTGVGAGAIHRRRPGACIGIAAEGDCRREQAASSRAPARCCRPATACRKNAAVLAGDGLRTATRASYGTAGSCEDPASQCRERARWRRSGVHDGSDALPQASRPGRTRSARP